MGNNIEYVHLLESIALLQEKQASELIILKSAFKQTYESLKPINLIKRTLQEVSASNEIKNDILENAIGFTTGYLSKTILTGTSHNPIMKLIGNILQFSIGNVVAKHSSTIIAAGEIFVQRMSRYVAKNK